MDRIRGAWVGAFVLAGLLLFAAGLFLIGDRRLLFADQFEVAATFSRVTGLQVGTRVRLAGLDAGEVLEIRVPSRPSERFVVRMRIREDLHPLVRTDSVCAIQTDGIVGNAFVQVTPGSDAAPIVAAGGVLEGRDPIELADLIQEGRDTFRLLSQQVLELTTDVSGTLTSLTKTIDTTEKVIGDVGTEVEVVSATSQRVMANIESVSGDARKLVAGVQAGEGTIGKLFTDTTVFDRLTAISREAEESTRAVREAAETTRTAVQGFLGPEGAGPQMTQTIHATLASIEEVTSDLAEGTEALKRNFIFRGFFRERGFYDLGSISREAYRGGLLERDKRTAVRVWLDAAVLFERDAGGIERLTADGRRRIESAMSQLVQYPRDSPLIVEGYATTTSDDTAHLASLDRARAVSDYVLTRFRRQAILTDVMPLGDDPVGSPRGDGHWSGVALALFVRNDQLGGGGR